MATGVESGYGGNTANPSYEDICTGRTGRREAVRVTFDPSVLSFRDLLTVFFTIHDPTTPNRQGNDVGTQYRSVVFCQSEGQRATTLAVIATLNAEKLWKGPIVTEVVTEVAGASTFYPAETYHQDYFDQNGNQPYCMFVVAPKVAKFRKAFAERLKRTVARALVPLPARGQPSAGGKAQSYRPEYRRQPTVAAQRPNTSGTAHAIDCTSDIPTPAACPCARWRMRVQQRHHHRLAHSQSQPQRERKRHQRRRRRRTETACTRRRDKKRCTMST